MGRGKKDKAKSGRRRKVKRPKEAPDKYALYQQAVQEPEADIEFIETVFRAHFGRRPHDLREDFCAAAYMACEWVAHHRRNRAWGVDLDPEPLAWSRRHNAARLDASQAERLSLIQGDVMEVRHEPVDVAVAFNFSYFCLQDRPTLVRYFETALACLGDEGLFVLDIYGGPEAQELIEETTENDDFDYVWDQDEFDPINSRMVCYIHFETPGGGRLQRAFTYDWRLWTIREVREALREAGFAATEVYWEGTDEETGEGDGEFTLQETAENSDSWIAYVVGVKK
jgi:hypothetical protein